MVIVPAGIGLGGGATPVPTLGERGLSLLAALMGGGGWWQVCRLGTARWPSA